MLGVVLVALVGCGAVPERDGPGSRPPSEPVPDAVPRTEKLSKYGNPDSYEVFGKRYYTLKSARGFAEEGIASWYGKKFHGRKTSSGEVYDMYQMTAAHKQLPLPTYVEVRNLENNRSAIVKVNDRGPFHGNRVIDLSYAAALKLGISEKGTGFVAIRALDSSGKVTPSRKVSQAAPTATQATVPEPPAATVAIPATIPAKPMPGGGVYLQVGAFQDRENANGFAGRIAGVLPGGVHINEIASQGKRLYRVQLGPIASVESADAVVAALEELGVTDHHFVTSQ